MQGEKMKKTVIIINGTGGVGKDTLCDGVKSAYKVRSVSSVDKIKEIARIGGWKGEKDDKGRLLLVQLKQAFVAYNDLPFLHMQQEYQSFLQTDEVIMFVHIREPLEIDKLKTALGSDVCKTLLVTRDNGVQWQNDVDKGVNEYEYDYYFDNNAPLEQSKKNFIALMKEIIEDK